MNENNTDKLNIFNIQRFTIHDGPGLRTELFLKGCPLHCDWCSNPESQKAYSEPGVYKSKCISHSKCGMCEEVCKKAGALQFYRGKLVRLNRSICTNCMKCVEECPADALKLWGMQMTISECMEIICKDRGFYEKSGGGVTVSGGEPLLQSSLVAKLLGQCKKEGINTCLESTFHVRWEKAQKVLEQSDIVISDIKHMDSAQHKKYTGVGNELILENLKKICDDGRELILRIPVIPGINDDTKNIEETAEFILKELQGRVRTLQLLSFMRLGEEKYQSLGMPYPMAELKFQRKVFQNRVSQIADYFNERGIHCLVGTKEKE